MDWFERYKYQMHRTRLLGVVGASLVVISGLIEVATLLDAVRYSEASLSDSEFRQIFVKEFAFVLSLVIIFSARLWVLFPRTIRPYHKYFASSAFAFAAALVYVFHARWFEMFAPPSVQECVPEPGRICFGIYAIARTSWILITTVFYVWLSILRAVTTAVYAVFVPKYK